MTQTRKRLALAGATGYIGHNLLNELKKKYNVIALSRNGDDKDDESHVEWRSCDLFSLQDTIDGLKGADIAIYLVHSMMPSAKLTQGSFEDMDLILADNYARAAKENGIQQIVYLSGIIPEETEELSRHLKSRLEVERVLGAYGTPVTTIRAALIVGPKGSSFPILSKLVKRLPVMLLPEWTRNQTHPVALPDVIHALGASVGREDLKDRAIDVGGPESMTYKEMILKTAEVMGKHQPTFDIPLMTVKLSRLWVTLVSGEPKETVYPLVESMVHKMVADPDKMVDGISDGKITFEESVRMALKEEQEEKDQKKQKKQSGHSSQKEEALDVRSVQRVRLPEGRDANWAADNYVSWLSSFAKPFLTSSIANETVVKIQVPFVDAPLLELTKDPFQDAEQATYRITGGLFAQVQEGSKGRIEFRQIPGSQECLIAIHEYVPALPWIIYKSTQANIHLLVMYLFKLHLLRLMQTTEQSPDESEMIVPDTTG
ncbi:NAD(P)H-binding protein [Exiguobacterium sp. Helios]|uniref:NAD(P)H-binding protein n=1 Tax=unclassified Exiguobacterium TaxID=2644629 RepID=UPI00165E7F6B|nr:MULTISPECIES: NAD(P)H-binding protein [unclassified Exiguobacterium]QNR21272.1 NAD(P)H-binding protein [Exiguobacterium sp. Helios]